MSEIGVEEMIVVVQLRWTVRTGRADTQCPRDQPSTSFQRPRSLSAATVTMPHSERVELSAGLTPEQLESWNENGYLLIPNALSQETAAELLAETRAMLDEFASSGMKDHPMTRFSTGQEGKQHVGDDYFLTSGDKVRFFFEEGEHPCRTAVISPDISDLGADGVHQMPSIASATS